MSNKIYVKQRWIHITAWALSLIMLFSVVSLLAACTGSSSEIDETTSTQKPTEATTSPSETNPSEVTSPVSEDSETEAAGSSDDQSTQPDATDTNQVTPPDANDSNQGEQPDTDITTAPGGEEETIPEQQPEDYSKRTAYDDMTKTSFGGKEFIILARDELIGDFKMDEDDDDPSLLDDMLITRNSVIETDLGVTLNVIKGGDYINVNETVKTQYISGLDDYDIAIGHKYTFSTCVVNNYLMDLGQIDAMSLDQEWWDQGCTENLTIQGKTYVASGDIQPSAMLVSSCFIFNKRMMKDLGQTEPYDLVRQYKWTLDAFNEYTADITTDMNGDGEMDYDKDRFGLSSWMMDIPFSMFYGAGGMLAAFDESGKPILSYENNDVINRYEKIYRGIIEQNAYFVTDPTLYETSYECFAGGHALFYDSTLKKVQNFLSAMTDDYGIVPVPMYDEMQKEYKSFVNGATGFIMIIATEADAEYVGTVLEAMARYNYQCVSPNLFEVISKLQSVRDEDSSEMVEYIIRNRVYDLAYFFDLEISNVVLNQLKEKRPEITSTLKSANKTSSKALNKILKGLD